MKVQSSVKRRSKDCQIVRRKARDIERYVGMKRFLDELERRGFRALENRGQIVIFCNSEPIRRVA